MIGAGIERVEHPDPRTTEAVDLEIGPDGSLEPVARLVAAGAAARLGLTVDRVEGLQRAVDAAFRVAPAGHTRSVHVHEADGALEVQVGPIDAGTFGRAELERVLSPLVDEVTTRHSGPSELWVDLRLSLARSFET